MLEYILSTQALIHGKKGDAITVILTKNYEYVLKSLIIIPEESIDKFSECSIKIVNAKDKNKFSEEIISHKFINQCNIKFKCVNIEPLIGNICVCALIYEFPQYLDNPGELIYFNISCIDNKLIDSLKINQQKRQDIYEIIDKYSENDFKGMINESGILGEYIAIELTKKIKKTPKNFRSALNILTGFPMTKRTKINYNYLGSLLWPLYYIRNQKLHPYHIIEFNSYIAEIVISNLSAILKYLSENQVRF